MRCSVPRCRRDVEVVVHCDELAVAACAADGVRLARDLGRGARLAVSRRGRRLAADGDRAG